MAGFHAGLPKRHEIRHMAEVVITGDFKPNLHRMMEGWIENPSQARASLPALAENGMPGWLLEIANKLGQRKKWDLN
jgi:hypothetical protein